MSNVRAVTTSVMMENDRNVQLGNENCSWDSMKMNAGGGNPGRDPSMWEMYVVECLCTCPFRADSRILSQRRQSRSWAVACVQVECTSGEICVPCADTPLGRER